MGIYNEVERKKDKVRMVEKIRGGDDYSLDIKPTSSYDKLVKGGWHGKYKRVSEIMCPGVYGGRVIADRISSCQQTRAWGNERTRAHGAQKRESGGTGKDRTGLCAGQRRGASAQRGRVKGDEWIGGSVTPGGAI